MTSLQVAHETDIRRRSGANTVYGLSENAPITFTGNEFEVSNYQPFRQNVIKDISRDKQGQKLIFVNNRATNWAGTFSDIPIFPEGSVFDGNVSRSDGLVEVP
jgi:hypothetical protein